MNTETSEKNILSFIRGNSKTLLGLMFSLILIFAISVWFINNSNNKKIKISENYIKAQILLNNGNKLEAKEILEKIVVKKNSVYSSLSLFLIIEKKLIEDKNKILLYFDNIIDSGYFKNDDLNLIKLKKAIYISDIEAEQDIINLLNPIINSESVWKTHAIKFLGDFYYSLNQLKKAKQYYSLLADIDNFPAPENLEKMELLKNE